MGEVVQNPVRNHSQRNAITLSRLHEHQTVDRFVQCRVSTEDDNRAITIVYQHTYQPFHAPGILALYHVIQYVVRLQTAFCLFPTLHGIAKQPTLRTINDAPSVFFYHKFNISSIFAFIGSLALSQCIAKPRRSMPRNHVICRFANWWMAISS